MLFLGAVRCRLASPALLIHSTYSVTSTTTSHLFSTTTTTTHPDPIMPQPPLQYETISSLDLSTLAAQIHETEAKRQTAFDLGRSMQATQAIARSQIGTPEAVAELRKTFGVDGSFENLNELLHTKDDNTHNKPRLANLSHRIEDSLRLEAYQHFVLTGELISLSEMQRLYKCSDDEYLAGAVMGLGHELSRYGLGRATVRDVKSVQMAARVVQQCQDYLLQLDFRNGPLRRKFDAHKYNVKALETLLYELAVTSNEMEPARKKAKHDDDDHKLFPAQELEQLKQRMERRDELRETLIKASRDSQKASKQAIFALHRGDVDKSQSLVKEIRTAIRTKLLPLVQEDPFLRASGSYTGVLEEFAEACFFGTWLYGKDFMTTSVTAEETPTSPSGILLAPQDFDEFVCFEPEEYLGGLCDLTGEVGRYAVQRGTERDVPAVRLCLQTNAAILVSLEGLGRLPGSIGKKIDAVRKSVEKIERMLYELSLSEAAGGRQLQSEVHVASSPGQNDNEE